MSPRIFHQQLNPINGVLIPISSNLEKPTYKSQLAFDTANNILLMALEIQEGALKWHNINNFNNIQEVDKDYEIQDTDYLILVDASYEIRIQLPLAEIMKFKEIKIKKVNGSDRVIINPSERENIDGQFGPRFIFNEYEVLTFISNGTNWFII